MNKIVSLRKEKGMTQAELAKYMGISQSTLSYWERGDYEPDFSQLIKLADFFDVTIDYLLSRSESRGEPVALDGKPLGGVYLRLARQAQESRLNENVINKLLDLIGELKD